MNCSTIALLALSIGVLRPLMAERAIQTNYSEQVAQLMQDLTTGRFAAVEARFDSQMTKALPQEKLSALWKEFAGQVGSFERVVANEPTLEPGGYHVIAVTCVFERNREGDALVTFDKSGHIAGFYFGPQQTAIAKGWTPPSYAHPERFHEVPLLVNDGPWHLPSTLTVPNGTSPFPAVALIPGSPPVDQDETVGPNKVFKDLAWGLASRGIAVLRYTKRTHQFGAGLGGGQISSFSLRYELLDDARAAIAVLARRSDIDHRHTYLLGHSMGGIAVPKLAATDQQVAGTIVMGTPAGDLLTALITRTEDSGGEGEQSKQQTASMVATFRKLRDGAFIPGETVDLFGQTTLVSYWDGLRNFRPGAAIAKLKLPALILVGGHDAEVTPDDVDQWKRALVGREDDSIKFYPDVFHLFMPSSSTKKGQDSPDDWTRPAHVTPEVVGDTASWILSHANNGSAKP